MKQPEYQGTFETHLSVSAIASENSQQFAQFCHNLGIKPILIQLPQGLTPLQPMTASYLHGSLSEVLSQVQILTAKLEEANFPVVRQKIEAMVTNQDIPLQDAQAKILPKTNYFEFHLKAIILPQEETSLKQYCRFFQGHLSKNAFKHRPDGKQERFITLRVYEVGLNNAQKKWNELLTGLKAQGVCFKKLQQEYTVYDSNLNLDSGWLE